jgi:hypothetical protein
MDWKKSWLSKIGAESDGADGFGQLPVSFWEEDKIKVRLHVRFHQILNQLGIF